MPVTCTVCHGTGGDGRLFLPLIDETGGSLICGLCVVAELPSWARSGDVTVFVTRRQVVPQN